MELRTVMANGEHARQPFGASQDFDQGQKAQANRHTGQGLKADDPIDRLGPAGGIGIGERQIRRGAIGALEAKKARWPPGAGIRGGARDAPGAEQVARRYRRQRFGRKGDGVGERTVRALGHLDGAGHGLDVPRFAGRRQRADRGTAMHAPARRSALDAACGTRSLCGMSNPAELPAAEATRRIRAGTLSAADLMAAYLDRVAAREPTIRAFSWLDPDAAMRAAEALDRRQDKGALAGIPFGVKDVIDTADMPSQYGSPTWAGHRPRSDAACVALARRAGAVVIGKTVTTEFATRHPYATTNPHNAGHTPGGSSSGSAAGVGGGLFPLAFGTQTGGSVIRPAAYCGITGFKPTYGTLHRAGMKVMSESLDTIGVMARDTGDCALAMSALTGLDHGDPTKKPGRAPRLALVLGPEPEKLAAETLALMERAAAACRRAGAMVTAIDLTAPVRAGYDAHALVMNAESAEAIAWEMDHAAAQLTEGLRERLDWGRAQGRAALDAARAAFATAQAAFPVMMEGYDAVLTPSAPGEAPMGLGSTGEPICNSLWTLLHGPCVSVPAGTGPKGLPLGVQLVARRGEDAATLGWGEWVRAALQA